jgi:hypothetical protein
VPDFEKRWLAYALPVGDTRARRMCIPSERDKPRKRPWIEILFFWGAYHLRSLLGLP